MQNVHTIGSVLEATDLQFSEWRLDEVSSGTLKSRLIGVYHTRDSASKQRLPRPNLKFSVPNVRPSLTTTSLRLSTMTRRQS